MRNLSFLLPYKPNPQSFRAMKKIDILNFITNFRKAPNDIKTHSQLLAHLGATNEDAVNNLLNELQQARVVRQTEMNGEKAWQVIAR